MLEINTKEVRGHFSSILDRVERGEEVVITHRGKRIARLTPLNEKCTPLPSLNKLRESIKIVGKPLSQTVIIQREEERYYKFATKYIR